MRLVALSLLALTVACARPSADDAASRGNEPGSAPVASAAPAAPAAAAKGNEPGSAPAPTTVSAELKEGDAAPTFSAKGDDGQTYSLAALQGKYVVLYFYPKDDTPGCTIEAKGFRDDSDKYKEKGAVVLGVSLDDAASHQAFRSKYQLNFPLLTDGATIAKAYGVPVHGYADRQTFVIGKDGKLLKIYRQVNPTGHSADILSVLK